MKWYDHSNVAIRSQPVTQRIPACRPAGQRPTHVRHVVLGLTVAAYMITYMDRQILAVARPAIRDELGISLVTMGWITFAFRMAYACSRFPAAGWATASARAAR